MSRPKSAEPPAKPKTPPVPPPEPAEDEKPRGIRCAGCGCPHFWLIYRIPEPDGRVRRRRECRNCGKRITTWEAVG